MKLLIDTHVLVWAESDAMRLGTRSRALLAEESVDLFLSPVSGLEMARLVALERLVLDKPLADWMEMATRHLQLRTAPFGIREGLESYALPGVFHKDPADRMLVATARLQGLTVVTADRRILDYPHVHSVSAA